MEKLKAKLHKQGGFTLIEMLIVVAIIAILIAVSIPIVNNALDRARQATDAANVRSAKAELMIQYLSETASADTVQGYDANEGSLKDAVADISGKYGKTTDHKDQYIWVVMHENVIYYQWAAAKPDDPTTTGALAAPWQKVMPTVADAA